MESQNTNMNIRISSELFDRVRKVADGKYLKTSEVIRIALREYCDRYDEELEIKEARKLAKIRGEQ